MGCVYILTESALCDRDCKLAVIWPSFTCHLACERDSIASLLPSFCIPFQFQKFLFPPLQPLLSQMFCFTSFSLLSCFCFPFPAFYPSRFPLILLLLLLLLLSPLLSLLLSRAHRIGVKGCRVCKAILFTRWLRESLSARHPWPWDPPKFQSIPYLESKVLERPINPG